MSFGGGIRSGVWLNELSRWDDQLLAPTGAQTLDMSYSWMSDLFLEASFFEGTRLSVFGGLQAGSASNPTVAASYIGVEPAFAFRRGDWELSVGLGMAMGGLSLEVDSGESMEASLTCLLYTSPSPRDLSTSRMPSSA